MASNRRIYSCQRCEELPDRCTCTRFYGPPCGVCKTCGATEQQHLIDLNNEDLKHVGICPP